MWIKCTNEATERLYVEGVTDEPLDFSDGNKIQVTKGVGESVVNRFDAITRTDTDDSLVDDGSDDDGAKSSSE